MALCRGAALRVLWQDTVGNHWCNPYALKFWPLVYESSVVCVRVRACMRVCVFVCACGLFGVYKCWGFVRQVSKFICQCPCAGYLSFLILRQSLRSQDDRKEPPGFDSSVRKFRPLHYAQAPHKHYVNSYRTCTNNPYTNIQILAHASPDLAHKMSVIVSDITKTQLLTHAITCNMKKKTSSLLHSNNRDWLTWTYYWRAYQQKS